MTEELKTLQDIDFEEKVFNCSISCVATVDEDKIKKVLRQEAIKWYKYYYDSNRRCTIDPAPMFIGNFFNLTKEDLK